MFDPQPIVVNTWEAPAAATLRDKFRAAGSLVAWHFIERFLHGVPAKLRRRKNGKDNAWTAKFSIDISSRLPTCVYRCSSTLNLTLVATFLDAKDQVAVELLTNDSGAVTWRRVVPLDLLSENLIDLVILDAARPRRRRR